MVSSKCFQVESPSPFKFFAALMPPCAHTECERFTGTMENKSHCPPISAILMTAASPASPPPTTIILGAAMLLRPPSVSDRVMRVRHVSVGWSFLEAGAEGVKADQSHDRQKREECQTQAEKTLLCLVAGNNPPLRAEEPDSISEVPR